MTETLQNSLYEIGNNARMAATALATASAEQKQTALKVSAQALRESTPSLLAANAQDLTYGEAKGLSGSMLDRLLLNPERIESIASSLEEVAALPDPVGSVITEWTRPNGLQIQRVSTPLGVIGVIYESRPNVTADAGALCLKSGNVSILRGGSESFHSAGVILQAMQAGLKAVNLPETAIQRIPTRDRDAVGILLGMTEYVDVIIPRGGRSLVERIQKDARVPVLAHLEGICHLYIDRDANLGKAIDIAVNSKMRRTGICGATECILFDSAKPSHIAPVLNALLAAGCEIKGCPEICAAVPTVTAATTSDFGKEFLAPIIAAKVVDGVDGAIDFITAHHSQHTDVIVTEAQFAADQFFRRIDSAIVMHNASTQFADGGEFGMGAEIGIATGKLHARGPIGAEQLTSFKYRVTGNGSIRG